MNNASPTPTRLATPQESDALAIRPDKLRLPDTAHGDAHARQDKLLVNAEQAAEMCSKSLRTWRTWDAGGLIPRPMRIGRSTLWRIDELRAWTAAGCPPRQEWEVRQ